MAYDPEARQTSNSAMIIGVIALVVVAGAVLAYYATQQPKATDTASTTIINNRSAPSPATNTVIVAPTVVPTPKTIVVPGKTETRIERRNTTVNRTIERTAPAPNASTPSGSSNTTINIAPPANTGSGATTGNATTGSAATGSTDAGPTDNSASTTDPATSTENSVANDAANDATSNSASGY